MAAAGHVILMRWPQFAVCRHLWRAPEEEHWPGHVLRVVVYTVARCRRLRGVTLGSRRTPTAEHLDKLRTSSWDVFVTFLTPLIGTSQLLNVVF